MSDTTPSSRPELPELKGPEAGTAQTKRILLVEGDGFTRLVLLLRLRLAGFAVDFTSNGILGLGKLRTCRPDILLLDLRLYGLSGLDLIKAARAEPGFGNRPVYVYTHAERMNRNARKELVMLATKVFDKTCMSREELVQTFATMLLKKAVAKDSRPASPAAKPPAAEPPRQVVLPGEIEEIVGGVREQCDRLANASDGQEANSQELLSRVCSLGSCAEAAGLANLARQAKALEHFLKELNQKKQSYTGAFLSTISRGVEVMRQMSCTTTAKPQELTRFNAVAVDEAQNSNKALEQALESAGFDPICFQDAGQARKHLASHRTDLILTNLSLPEAHGLALADIRELPLHAETPVIVGPEAIAPPKGSEELPTSARRLDGEALLLSELVVRALNEVQSPNPAAEAQTEKPAQATADTAGEDGFQFFAKAPSNFIDPSIPNEPFSRAEPGIPAEDREAEFLIRLPEAAVDRTQTEEQALEALPPSPFFVEPTEPAQPEAIPLDHATRADWLAAAASEPGQAFSSASSSSTQDQNEAAAVPEVAAAALNHGEVMNNQVTIASAPYAPEGTVFNGQSPREDLAARVCAAEMALYHAKAEVERKDKTIEALQSQLAEQTGEGPSPAEQQAQARCAELEQEVASLRQVLESLGQQPDPAVADDRSKELEERLNKQQEEQAQNEAELRQQLAAAQAATQPLETARQQVEAKCAQLEQDLATLRQAHEELAKKAAPKTGAGAQATGPDGESVLPESELEQQVRQGVAALAKATAELAKERGERQRSQQRATELNERMQALHEDLKRTLQNQREDQERISALEEEQRQATQALEGRTADLEQQQAEHSLLADQLQKAKAENAQLRKDLAFFDEANKKFGGNRQELQARLEASLNAARENETRLQQEMAERQRLAENLENLQREMQTQSRRREGLEVEVQAMQEALKDREAKLQKESAERQRLNEALRAVQGNAQDRSERDLELTKLQSSLELEQVERKRQETQLARIRQKAVDAAHAARALRTNLRRQIRQPVDNLVHSTRTLLESEMGEEQKQLAENVLQDVLLLQTRLREPDLAHDSAEPDVPSATP